MSPQQNIELHALAVAAVNAREVPTEILAPGFCMEHHASAVTDYTYHGATGWQDWMDDVFEEFVGSPTCELEEIVAAAEDCVVAILRVEGRSAHSGMPISFRWAGVTWFRDGKATRTVGYTTRDEALQATGIRPRIGDRRLRRAERVLI